MNLAQFNKKAWQLITFTTSVLAVACAGWITWNVCGSNWSTVMSGALLGGLIVGPLMVLLGSVNLKLNYLRGQIKWGHTSLREMTNIRPLLDGPPLNYGKWAIDPFLGKVLAQQIYRHKPAHILECGSGNSTVLMAQLLQNTEGNGNVTALEHLSEYAEKSEQLLVDHDMQNGAEVVYAPLSEWTVDGKELLWYGIEPSRFSEQRIDMLVVDGPPASTGPLARYPAVFVLQEYLAEDCVIIMDDGDRPDEERAAHRWAEVLGADIEYMGGPKGTYILRCEE